MRDLSDIVYDTDGRQPCEALVDGAWCEATLRAWHTIEDQWWAEISYQPDRDIAFVTSVPMAHVRNHPDVAPT